jgi:hypothetical protein
VQDIRPTARLNVKDSADSLTNPTARLNREGVAAEQLDKTQCADKGRSVK